MRSVTVWVFTTLLVISWAGVSQGDGVTQRTGAENSVKDLAASFQEAKTEDGSKRKPVTIDGVEVSVNDIIQSFELLKHSPKIASRKGGPLPTFAQVKAAVEDGKKLGSDWPVCRMRDDDEFTEGYDWWYDQVCIKNRGMFDPDSPLCSVNKDKESLRPWYSSLYKLFCFPE